MAAIFNLSLKEKQILAVLLPGLLLGLILPSRLTVTTTPSVSHRVFFLAAPPERGIERGDYLVFDHDGKRLLKQVGCGPGDFLTAQGGMYTCNGHSMGRALAADSQGHSLSRFNFRGIIPHDLYFMLGQHERSLDSRYFGLINAPAFTHKAYPIW